MVRRSCSQYSTLPHVALRCSSRCGHLRRGRERPADGGDDAHGASDAADGACDACCATCDAATSHTGSPTGDAAATTCDSGGFDGRDDVFTFVCY